MNAPRIAARLLALVCVASLGACFAAREPDQRALPVELPGAYAARGATDEAPAAARWWAELGDPGLVAAVEEAFEHNRDLFAAAARVEAALAEARVVGADLSPSVRLAADAGRNRQNFIGLPLPGGEDVLSSTSTSVGVAVEVAWEPDLWGRLRALERAAGAEARASTLDLAAAHLSLAGQVASTWFALAEARAQITLANETVESFRANTEVIAERYRVGRAEALEVHLLENQLAVAEAALELRLELEARAIRRIELLLGRVPSGAELGAADLPPALEPVPVGLPADLAWRRPDLAAAEERLAALDSRLAAARADLWPSLLLTGSAGRRSSELSDLFDTNFDVWSLAASLVQPLFEGGRLRARVDVADAQARAALEELAQSYLVALSEVDAALAAEEHLARREAHLERAVREASFARQIAEERYFEGLVDVLFLLDAQRRDLLGKSELLDVRRRRFDTRIDLHLALGGGFDATTAPLLEPYLHVEGAAPTTDER